MDNGFTTIDMDDFGFDSIDDSEIGAIEGNEDEFSDFLDGETNTSEDLDKEFDDGIGDTEDIDDFIVDDTDESSDSDSSIKLTDDEIANMSTEEIQALVGSTDEGFHEETLETIENESQASNVKLDLDDFETIGADKDFISDSGDIVVQDTSNIGDNFVFQYIDIEKIAIVKRIRKNTTNVEDLVKSIKSTGLLEPLVVAPTATEGVYVLLAGFRRIMACAKIGKRNIPCIVNTKATVSEIPVLEALYNHSKKYNIKEIIEYIDYLEKQKGILSASMIEYLLQLNSGDYTKLKDLLDDNDDEILSKLYEGQFTIETAFKKLEQRRKKESAEERENKKAARVYDDEEQSGASDIADSGDKKDEDEEELTEQELKSLAFNAEELDSIGDESVSLDTMVEEGKQMEGFEPNRQDYKHRERLDPTLRKSVIVRDKNACQCCGIAGQEYIEVFDIHHIIEVFLGGSDDIDNLITLCTCCHKLVHLYARGELHIRPESELGEEERAKFKKIVKLGNIIRNGMAMKGMKREQLKKVDQAETIGRTKPGTGQVAG